MAQVDLIDPDVPAVKKAVKAKPAPADDSPADDDVPTRKTQPEPPPPPEKHEKAEKHEKKDLEKKEVKDKELKEPPSKADAKKADARKAPEPPPPPRAPPAPLLVTKATDADLEAAWTKWKKANASPDVKAETDARKDLLKLSKETGASNLEAFSQGMIRAALVHEAAGDSAGAIDIGLAAVDLAPDVPATWLGLAKIYLAVDPSGLPRIFGAFKTALVKTLFDSRYLRPAVGDLVAALVTALTALAVAVVLVLFARRARYFFYDFHFLFPRALSRWQSGTIALLILLLPIVFRMGLAPALLAAFAAVVLYLTTAERVVAAVLIALLGALPSVGALVVRQTAFAGTPAEAVYLLEHGGVGSEVLAGQLAKKASEEKASFAELFALGRFELRRGKLDLAIPRLKAALLKKPNEPNAQLNLGVAMLLNGDLENPKGLFEDAARALPTSAEPLFDLARLYQRRGATLGRDVMAAETDRANAALAEARARNPAFATLTEPGPGEKLMANTFLITLPLDQAELLTLATLPESEDRVRSQLTGSLLGDLPEVAAPFFPLAGALALLAIGLLAGALEPARACARCGAPVSRRGDRELGKGSTMCMQCVNVFARKGVVPTSLKVRKQLDIAKYETRMERIGYAFGLACSGMGHVFTGLVVRGTVYGFLFLLMIVLFLQRNGVLRAPYEAAPLVVRLAPLGLVFVLVYLLSLRGLSRRHE